MECLKENCRSKAQRRGYCDKHYRKALSSKEIDYKLHRVNGGGATKHPLYPTWQGMVQRCTKPYIPCYKDYGARGIKVCERWSGMRGFWNFIDDMGERPHGYTLDRIDNNKGYEPANCRWADRVTQRANRRSGLCRAVGVKCRETGEQFSTIKEAAEKYKTCFTTLKKSLGSPHQKAGGVHWEYL